MIGFIAWRFVSYPSLAVALDIGCSYQWRNGWTVWIESSSIERTNKNVSDFKQHVMLSQLT
jgi:hypothetical protein